MRHSLRKTDIVIGNGELLMMACRRQGMANNTEGVKVSVTFPANGMIFGELRRGVVRVAINFG